MQSKSTYQRQLNSMLDLTNVFMIKPMTQNGLDLKIAIDYNPQFSETLGCMLNTVPIFNNDEDPTQHGFILQIDQAIHLSHSSHYRNQYEKKLAEVQEKNRNLFVPKPRGTNIFCNVCKEYIEDYLQHTESGNHKLKFGKNKIISLISNMVDEFQKTQSIPHNTLNLPSNSNSCGYYQLIQDESTEHCDTTQQQEPQSIKKIKLNDGVSAYNKLGNSLVNSSEQSFNDKLAKQCL
ncbi:unnamed protein product [Paramecium sonneborni]|uniref:DBF4-type domain-containing protein n=1 Tax=Paramecium sonneborni TaxID=65129 RepID=A0A8S1N7P0_9CILI|nr:unnamed protein product [Paramecium sonneborni]